MLPDRIGYTYNNWAFPQGTEGLFKRIKREAPPDIPVVLGSADDDYHEHAQYHDWWRLPLILLTSPEAVSFMINLLSAYVYDRLQHHPKGPDLMVKSRLRVKDATGTYYDWKYQGPAESFEPALREVAQLTTTKNRIEAKDDSMEID